MCLGSFLLQHDDGFRGLHLSLSQKLDTLVKLHLQRNSLTLSNFFNGLALWLRHAEVINGHLSSLDALSPSFLLERLKSILGPSNILDSSHLESFWLDLLPLTLLQKQLSSVDCSCCLAFAQLPRREQSFRAPPRARAISVSCLAEVGPLHLLPPFQMPEPLFTFFPIHTMKERVADLMKELLQGAEEYGDFLAARVSLDDDLLSLFESLYSTKVSSFILWHKSALFSGLCALFVIII